MDSAKFQVGGSKANYVLIISSLLNIAQNMKGSLVPIVLEPMRINLCLTDTQAGLLVSGASMAAGILVIPIGYCVDQWRRSRAIAVMALITGVNLFLAGLGQNFLGVFIPLMLASAGLSGFVPAANALITASFPEEKRASVLGIFSFFAMLGAGLGMILGGFLSAHVGGWRTPFFVFAVPLFFFGILAFFMQDYTNSQIENKAAKKSGFFKNAKTLIAVPTLGWLYIGGAMNAIILVAFFIWIPTLIIRRFEVGEDVTGVIMVITGALSAAFVPLGGILADRWQQKYPNGRMRFVLFLQTLGSIAIILTLIFVFILYKGKGISFSIWLVMGCITFSIFCVYNFISTPALMASSQAVVPFEMKGMSWSIALFFITIFGEAWSPALTGYMSDRFGGGVQGLTSALLILSPAGFLSIFCYWMSARHYAKDVEKINASTSEMDYTYDVNMIPTR